MGVFDKKKAFSIGSLLTGAAAVIAVLANISEIVQLFDKDDKPEKPQKSVAVVETVEESAEETIVEPAEVVEGVPPKEVPPSVVYLDSLKSAESYRFYENVGNAEDTIGNKYAGHVFTIGDRDAVDNSAYTVYYLGGKYQKLSGTIAVDDVTYEDSEAEISISCDDNVVYGTGTMGRISVPVEFSVAVENCQWLRISNLQYNSTGKFILSDFKLE